jgi:hypothetical protein
MRKQSEHLGRYKMNNNSNDPKRLRISYLDILKMILTFAAFIVAMRLIPKG